LLEEDAELVSPVATSGTVYAKSHLRQPSIFLSAALAAAFWGAHRKLARGVGGGVKVGRGARVRLFLRAKARAPLFRKERGL